jgi:O-antigen/teichoic acid export membrane protein
MISCRLVPAIRFRYSEIRWGLARELTGFGFWNVVGNLSDMIRKSSDPVILNRLGTAVDVTSFYLGSIPSGMIQGTVSQAKSPLMPALTAMHATDREDRLQNAYLRGGRYALWALLFPIVPLIVFSQEVIRLYVGDPYMPAATVMALLLGFFPFVHGHAMFPNIAVAKAEMRSLALRALAVQVLNLLLTLYLVGVMRMGAVGSALGTFISMTVAWPLLNWRYALRMVNLNYRRWLRETVWPGLLPALPAAVVLLAMKWLVQPSSWLVLGLCTAAGLACYGAVLVCFCLQPADKADFRHGLSTIASVLRLKREDRSQ